ncbi:MAG: diguanylate cyclase [Armatimonadetes bacterium]|nr:diguanylate cyclase [Armatimonadota bacterium]
MARTLITVETGTRVTGSCRGTMQSIRALKLLPVWVSPDHLVSTARIILSGHNLRTMAVIEDGQIVGVVSQDSLVNEADFAEVRVAMLEPKVVLDGDLSVREAADLFVRENVDFAPVAFEGRYLGMINSNMLLRELGRSWDPLTGLSWSDQLREWGVENLKRGNEVTILFIDLDDFGHYNKRYGHIVGDHVLKRVAAMLLESVDRDRDVLVRYGGDEFAIGTLRERSEAEIFAAVLKRKVHEIFVGETEEGVDFTIGMHGGKRSKERENIHFAATLDNLINLASKDCIAQKTAKTVMAQRDLSVVAAVSVEEKKPEAAAGIKVVSVFADDHTSNSLTQVIISVGDAVVSGVSARMGKSVIESIALATAKALERRYPERPLQINDIHLTQAQDGRRMVTVSAQVTADGKAVPVGGVMTVENDLYTDVANATLQAFQQSAPTSNR